MLDMCSGSGAVPSKAICLLGWIRAFLFETIALAQKTIEQNIEFTKSEAISFKQ